jgi:hypothetical protein
MLRRLLLLAVDALARRKPRLVITAERINEEERLNRRRTLDEDVEYRTRVSRRMTTGASGRPETWLTAQKLSPLINRDEFLRAEERARLLLFGRR